jgi:hypothetical protein
VSDKKAIFVDAIVDDREDNMDFWSHEQMFLFPANHNIDHSVTANEQREAWQNIVEALV